MPKSTTTLLQNCAPFKVVVYPRNKLEDDYAGHSYSSLVLGIKDQKLQKMPFLNFVCWQSFLF
jgi:hypothetical protein